MAAFIRYRCSDSHACIRPLRCQPYLVQTENMKGRPFGALFLQGANGIQVGWRSKTGTTYNQRIRSITSVGVLRQCSVSVRWQFSKVLGTARHSMHDIWMRSSHKPGVL